jgi:hypothetical protein
MYSGEATPMNLNEHDSTFDGSYWRLTEAGRNAHEQIYSVEGVSMLTAIERAIKLLDERRRDEGII